MIKILNLIILILLTNFSYSQQKKKKNTYPESTIAIERSQGYEKRLSLNKN